MSEVDRRRRSPTQSTANVDEASGKNIAGSLHRNVLSWAVWRGHKQKKSVSFAAVTPAANSQAEHTFSCCAAPNLLRTRSVPDVVGTNPASSASTQNASTALDPVCASSMRFLTPQPFGRRGFSKSKNTMRMTNSQPDFCRGTSSKPNELRQTYSPSDRLAVKEPGRRKEQVVHCEGSVTEWDGNPEGSLKQVSSRTSFCSCITFDVPLSSVRSVIFLVKSRCILLEELERSPTLQTSTLSLRLGVSSVTKCKQTATHTNHRRASNKCSGRESGALSHCRGLQSKQRGRKVEQIAPPAYSVNSEAHHQDTQRHSATPGLLSFRGPSHANIKAARQKGNADEAVQTNRSNLKHRLHTFHIGPESSSWDKQAESDKKEEELEHDCNTKQPKSPSIHKDKTCYYHSRLKDDSVDGAAKSLSLQEALERFRPDFISRSQSRVKRLEQRARRRRALHGSNPDLVHGLREDRGKQKRNCTTPDPLSDNLFKPRERTISGREMQLRSRRIYNKLPEVTRKKEEEKRRAVSQTNRLRAEVFKKKLLDQVLQR